MDIIRIILAIILPPLGVLMQVGIANKHFWINIILTCFGFLPGIIHAVWVITKF
ncbi:MULTISPECIES: YqaE/Pmp3 family membrane protein [unclassified Cobetia]|uniref:YqaE/Pmp3 family membrane protein n=1 Tax=unclassified Cobetia TaxID=2609414 RepID=UPI00159E8503|nr:MULTISPECIES: YqaE/Pmp3 family membrane protein [unclassified Cobetia]MCO7231840.1 YqaE/Pmp3 family membrane protein [Cobetia sp. Dlab-2-AX]MCO7234844.1 YqaE/Pmp3 family membrane protein [Cobetia sp. Dlab-2-U]NVN55394.1 YqaE/Pmp3 family membrane protein [bacterium Scap17]